ncbi:MAG TPA: peptidyl-alpha-hydroxyglycine alpha-amidating lyase family protein [Terriglobia bacterium]|nr:peptidyl-alpha-hydroxyglycine alpha-amidating lyase family protein [Terriglobia bacterium]
MKQILRFAAVALAIVPWTMPSLAQRGQNIREIPYASVSDFLKLPPNVYMGEGIGVARDSRGHVYTYTRSGVTRLYEFDEKGVFVREISPGNYAFEMAHAVRVDPQDNVWIVDEGTNMVVKFNRDGRAALIIGRRPDPFDGLPTAATFAQNPNPPLPYRFDRPTDIAFDAAGNFFVADGYGNSRIAKYDKTGRFLKTTGSRGNGPGQLNTPHSIQTDAAGNVYVADRGNNRIQVYDNDLNLIRSITGIGSPWAVCITPAPHQYLYSSNSSPENNNSAQVATSGEIYKMELDGTVLGKFGKGGKMSGEFSTTHAMDCRVENELLIGEITSWRVQKVTLKPQSATGAGK